MDDDFCKKQLLAERGIKPQGSWPESSLSSEAGTALFTHGSKKPQETSRRRNFESDSISISDSGVRVVDFPSNAYK